MARIRTSHVAHANESWHIYERVMSHRPVQRIRAAAAADIGGERGARGRYSHAAPLTRGARTALARRSHGARTRQSYGARTALARRSYAPLVRRSYGARTPFTRATRTPRPRGVSRAASGVFGAST